MDNFTGLFEDGELENLDLGGESFGTPQGPTPVSVPEMDLASYTQSYTDIGSTGNTGSNTAPSQIGSQGPPQKMTLGGLPQPNQSPLGNYSNQTQTYQYASATTSQQPAGQFAGGQYRSSFPGQEIYTQGPAVATNSGIPNWNTSDPFSQVPGSYQQQAPSSFPQAGINSYPNQNISSGPVNNIQSTMTQSYQGLPPQNNMSQGYTTGSQGIPYQGAPRPSYPNYDPQSPIGSASNVTNFNSGGQPATPGQSQQQYPLMQNPRQPYHIGQYAQQQSQVPMAPQQQPQQQPPPPPQQQQQQASQQQQQVPGQQIICGPRPQGDISQYSNSPVPNGTPYRAPFPQLSPQLSPHPQASPRPQLSPMPRSMSPHARPNSGLAMTSPVSSPAALPSSSSSPNPNSGAGSAANLQQLENLVKPSGAGRNTPTNPPCTTPTQQPLHSPGIYGNSGVHSPMGQRAPMSPGLLNRPPVSNPMSPGLGRPPLSPQQWQQTRPISHQNYIQANFNQGVITVQRPQAPSSLPQHANTIPHGQISNDSSLSTDSIASVSDSSLNINGSAIGVSNGPVTSNIVIENITVSLESGHINDNVLNSVDSEASCGPGITNVVSIVNGTMPLSESIPGQCNMSPNVPPSNISPGGAPSSLVSSSGSPQLTPSGNVPPNSLAQGIGPLSAGATIENGLSSNSVPITGPIKVMHHIGSPISSMSGSPMPSVAGSPGNTMVRISGPPQGPRLSYPQQGYLLIGPRVCGPPQQGQSNQMAPGSPHQANSSTVVTSSTIMKSNKLSNLNRGHLVGQNSPTTISVSQTPIPQESPGSQSLLSEEIGEHHNLHEIRPPETIQLSANATVPPQQPILHTISQPVIVSNDPGILTQNAGGKITNGPLGPTGCVQMAASLPSETSLPSQGTGSQPLQNSNQLQTQVLHTTTVTLHPVNNQSSVVAPNQIVTGNQVVAPVQSSAGSTIPSGAPMVAGRTQAAPLQPIVRPVQPAGTQAQPPPIQPQLNLSIEIQQCQQQLQQMFKMPQSVQTQQKINELQQRLTHLQQQQQKQQQHFLQNQAYYSSQTPASSDSPEKKAVKKKISKPRTPKEPKPPKTPKPKKEAKPKEPKAKKEPKIKTPKEPKPPKEQKPKKEKPAPKRSRKKPTVNTPVVPAVDTDGQILPVDSGTGAPPAALMDTTLTPGTPVDSAKTAANATPKPKSEKKTKVKNSFSSKKKSNSKMNLNSKSKRKRRPSESDFSESEGITLPKAEGNDDDESKRRSGRNQGSRKKYVDELELNLSEEDELKNQEPLPEDDIDGNGVKLNYVVVDPNGEDAWAVQMIMSVRIGEREIFSDSEELDGENKKVKIRGKSKKIEVEEFFVKYKTFSYLHCEWKTEEELLKGDKRIQGKIKRFKQKRAASQNIMDFLEEEPFNPDYVEIDRILDCLEYNDPESGKVMRHYLVKWKALPYEDVTWELEEDCDVEKIELFQQYRNPPPKAELRIKKRPKPEEWKKLEASPIYKNNNQLREYQLEGLNWLNFSYYNGHNCILADEMGLGKTIQSLAFVHSIFSYGIRGPYLIIAPLSTIPNWQREFEGWTDLNVIVYHGSQASRNMILEYEMYYKDAEGEKIPNVYKFHVLITTFEVIISDSVELKEINWRCCIIDEAHRLKNRNCKLLEGLRIMHMEHRVLLSGTPLQNNVNELFSLLNFLEPSQFSCQETFLQEFGKLETEEQVKKLQALLKPMMLRRMKEDVEKSLAPKEETIIEVELTNIQKKYYRAILERNFDFLIKGATYTNVPSLMNTVMELRKCCLHPYLLNGAEDGIQQDYKDYHPQAFDIYHNALIQSSGKMVLVDKLLPRLKANGHRVLIFSQMVKLLDIIEDYLIYRKYPYERLDGRIRGNLRQAAIDRFCKPDSDRFVFLLCTKAGGLGINLTAADTVIIYDSDWNPQNDLQAQARCHRIGQQKCVKIYRLLCRNTYEREMFDKASLKLGLDKAVLQSMNTEVKAAAGNSLGLSKKDIEDLLKKGAYGALMEEDNQGDKFCEEDIDQIMSRRTTVITLESEKGSTFSKASFSASSNRSDIDLDDPDFWKKWAKRADIDLEAGEKQLIMEEPRRRSQIRRYGHDESVMDCSDLETSASDSGGEQEQTEDAGGETRSRTRRGRGRGKTRGQRNSRNTRSSRWNTEEEPGDMDEVKYGQWHRSECFKVEKGLLTYGWGRWEEIMKLGEFRSAWKVSDIQECARMILLFCIRYYRGDDKIKGFIFDLIAPTSDGKTRMHHNHIGLSAPVPRGRKGKKKLREAKLIASHMEGADWAKEEKFDTDTYLDQGYSRHLTRHANKVLLRVRLLFYIKQEIIGDLSSQIEDNCRANDLPIHPPPTELPPKPWWDSEADRNILVGVYKHGYDRYNVVRNDPYLCFLARCGPPDKAALVAEMSNNVNEDEMEKDDKEEKEEEKDDSDSNQTIPASPAVSSATNKSEEDATKEREKRESKLLPFPSSSDINGRLRRLVTSYQRNNKKMEMRKEANVRGFDHYLADKLMRRERMAEYIRERELRKADYNQRRWSNREQAEFYRTISTFGVEYIRKEKRYDWNKFRMLSRLEKRLDENLTEYFRAFMAMCKRQCGIRLSDQENAKIVEVGVDRLPEERARRVLERVDLLNRLRNDILPHPDIQKALAMALPSKDLPDWWIPGKHDLDLVRGVARHGLGRTDYYILYDPDLCFREILRRHTAGEPLITKDEKEELNKKFYKGGKEEEEEDGEEEREDEDGKEDISSKEKTDNAEELKSELSEDDKESATEALKDEETALQKAEDLCTKESSDEKELENKTEDDPEEKGEDGEKLNSEQETDPKEDETENNESVQQEPEHTMLKEEKDDDKASHENIDKKELNENDALEKEEPKDEKNEVQQVDKELKEELKDTKDAIPAPPLLSLQQMDEAMSKMGSGLTIDSLAANEPTVAQLLAQSAANPIKWPKDRVLQTRLEHMMYAVEHKKWPVPIDFQSSDHDLLSSSKCDTPPSAPSTPTGHHPTQELLMMEVEKRKRRHMEEVERAHLQAMLHPNLHHNMALSKVPHTTAAAAAAAAAALGFNPNSFSVSNLRSFMEANDPDKKTQSMVADSHAHALRQLQALQGSLDLTIKPVSSQSLEMGMAGYLNRRGPGRPRLDEPMLKNLCHNTEKRRACESPHDKSQDKKRRKLDDIVLGLSSSKGKSPDGMDAVVKEANNPLALLKGSSVTLLTSKDKAQVTPAVTTPKLSSSISITPTSLGKFPNESKGDCHSPGKGFNPLDKEGGGNKPGLVKSSDLPPGISLPPGIELYRPTDSAKVDKWLEQHQDHLLSDTKRDTKRRKIDFTSLDWTQFSGDEHVPVVNTSTGQKLNSSECPKLKHLAQWLMEHPNYDVDPHWSEAKKESGASNSAPSISDLQRRLLSGDKKSSSNRGGHSISSPMASPSVANTSPTTSAASSSGVSSKNMLDPRHLLQGLDLKNPMTLAALTSLDPKLLANLDPKILFGGIDPKLLGIDPKQAFDPKILAAMGIDPKLFGMDLSKHQEQKPDKKPSPAPSPSSKSSDPKPSTSHGIDPKTLGLDPKLLAGLDPKLLGFDPKLLAGLDPKALAGIDPKSLGLDPKLLGVLDPKLLSSLGAAMDPKFFAGMGGMDPVMMMAGFGGLPGMAGLGLANPLLAGLPAFNLPGMPNIGGGSSKSKDNQRNAAAAAAAAVAASQANLFSGMFGSAGAAGLMYPPLGLGGLGNFQLSQMSVAQSSGLLNGFSPTITATAGSSKVQTSSAGAAARRQQQRQDAERERDRKERLKDGMKAGGLSKEERHLLKQMKAERLARVDPRTTVQSHEALLASHLSQLSALGQIDLSVRPISSSGSGTNSGNSSNNTQNSAGHSGGNSSSSSTSGGGGGGGGGGTVLSSESSENQTQRPDKSEKKSDENKDYDDSEEKDKKVESKS